MMKQHRIQWVVAGCMLVTCILAGWLIWHSTDNSRALSPRGGYSLWDVPITQNLARSLQNCSFYKRTYQDPIFYQLWNNRLGQQDTLIIRPGLHNTCVITHQTGSLFSPLIHQDMQTAIPRALAKRTGEILLSAFENTPQAHADIQTFAACINGGYDVFHNEDIFSAGLFELFTHDLEDYLQQWGLANLTDIRHKEDAEETHCTQVQHKLENLINTPGYRGLSPQKKRDLLHQTDPLQSCGWQRSTWVSNKQDKAFVMCYSGYFNCKVEFTSQHVSPAQFTRKASYRPPVCF